MQSDFLSQLNKEQRQAVENYAGPSLILAGAGSGKTRVLISKVIFLLNKGVPAEQIMMVTFTNKAADEMQKRAKISLGYIGTFHSFCARVLRMYGNHIDLPSNFVIYDKSDQDTVIKQILKKSSSFKKYSTGFILNRISNAKDRLLSPDQYGALFTDEMGQYIFEIYKKYQKKLSENNALDFDDLILKTVLLLDTSQIIREKLQRKYQYFLIDEFQDTNYAQYVLMKYLGQKSKNITVVGDFSQSIYSFRGAEIENLNKFQKDFSPVKVFNLTQNYRCTDNILNFAYKVISNNQLHPVLQLYTKNGPGEEVEVEELASEQHEALYIAEKSSKIATHTSMSDIAVLYRINAQSRAIEEVFLHLGIPYILVGGTSFYQRKEIKDVISYVRLIVNPDDKLSEERAIKIGKTRFKAFLNLQKKILNKEKLPNTLDLIDEILKVTKYLKLYDAKDESDYSRLENIKELRSVAQEFYDPVSFIEQVSLVEQEYSREEKRNKNGISMMTLHQAKGLEFPYVFIVGVEEGILPHSRSMFDRHDLEEERRLFYVGATRAMKKLYLTHVRKRFFFGARTNGTVSRFLQEAGVYESWDN